MRTNALINESSPYLLLHAHNPVDWLPWSDTTLEKAKREDKPILVSIGYSACHWCHVMEKESFEDVETAALMNRNFICIKVDREERPDIDQLYMSAVQLMSGQGGWPLNCFAMPDGRPFYGGTYFPKEKWQDVLAQISSLYRNDLEKVEEYAIALSNGIQKTEILKVEPRNKVLLNTAELEDAVGKWIRSADHVEGGSNRAPKFPMPNNFQFLLRYGWTKKDNDVLNYVHLTLQKMAFGGIYDHLGGGFARYSTDAQWKVPHFEKMLYDNAQLLCLYAEAWQQDRQALYKSVCDETAGFILRELRDEDGWFYASLDADSEGIEGLYYTWEKEEIQELLDPEDYRIFSQYYNLNALGYWEDERHILLRKKTDSHIANELGISIESLQERLIQIKTRMLAEREKRIHPGLDNKLLVSWNGLMIRAFADLYRIFGNKTYLKTAEDAAAFILGKLRKSNGRLMHTRKIEGFLEDYSMMADACIALFQASYDEKWIIEAKSLCEIAISDFQDEKSNFFWFNTAKSNLPLSRLMEVGDHVIPASNSIMALNLQRLGTWFEIPEWISLAEKMLEKVSEDLLGYPSGYSNWGMLALLKVYPAFELAACGETAKKNLNQLRDQYLPDVLIAACGAQSTLPFMEGRTGKEEQYFVCRNQSCLSPVLTIQEVDQILQKGRSGSNA